MKDLHPCAECARHVRIDETGCPFCGARLSPGAPKRFPVGHFTRAAVFAGALAGAAGCGSGSSATSEPKPPITDAGVDDDTELPDADYNPVDMPYGAPPARSRTV